MQRDVVRSEGLPLNGTYLSLVLEVEKMEVFDELEKKNPRFLILSTMFPHEMKVSAMHFRIKRTLENDEIVPSKNLMEFSCGFRRLVIQPTFSKEINPTGKNDKYKYMRFLRKDMDIVATAFCPIVYAGCKVIAFTKQDLNTPVKMDMVASGLTL